MKLPKNICLSLIGTFVVFVFVGCAKVEDEDSTIPWSRPADWEGKVPGMGGR